MVSRGKNRLFGKSRNDRGVGEQVAILAIAVKLLWIPRAIRFTRVSFVLVTMMPKMGSGVLFMLTIDRRRSPEVLERYGHQQQDKKEFFHRLKRLPNSQETAIGRDCLIQRSCSVGTCRGASCLCKSCTNLSSFTSSLLWPSSSIPTG